MKVHRTTSELHDTIEGYKTLIEEQNNSDSEYENFQPSNNSRDELYEEAVKLVWKSFDDIVGC